MKKVWGEERESERERRSSTLGVLNPLSMVVESKFLDSNPVPPVRQLFPVMVDAQSAFSASVKFTYQIGA